MADEIAGGEDQVEELASSVASVNDINDLEPKMRVSGTVERLELYGAFVDLGIGTSAILHISKLGKRVNRVSDVLSVGDTVEVWVESVDPAKEQITITMQEPVAVEWSDLKVGNVYEGTVTRLEKFGAFVDIGSEKEGLVHISELDHEYVKHPSEAVKVGDGIQVKVLGFSKRKRRIDLSRKALLESPEAEVAGAEDDFEDEEDESNLPTAMEIALRRAMDNGTETSPGDEKKSATRATSSKKKRDLQEDILNRTLRLNQDKSE